MNTDEMMIATHANITHPLLLDTKGIHNLTANT